ARGRESIIVGGVDAMPPAVEAVLDGRMYATVRNPSCRIHGGSIVAGVAAVLTNEEMPKHVITDGPVVTKANAPGMLWMQKQFLI
ncbi:MAG: ABC transporter substrate-binding protein, partial [Pseudomonadota bacterium]